VHSRRALKLYRAAGHRNGQAIALNVIGWQLTQLGHHRRAIVRCQQALAMDEADEVLRAYTRDSLGYAHHHLGRHVQALAYFQESLQGFRAFGSLFNEAEVLTHLGDTHQAIGDSDGARTAWQKALHISDQLAHPIVGEVRARLATI
jgi:tetratricopeptide (TPR) repeat protein